VKKENLSIRLIEKNYMKEKRQRTYVACEDLDFIWDERDIKVIERMWSSGLSIYDISRSFNRDPDEVVVLIIDRSRRGSIKPRKGGVLGCRRSNGI